jgi:cyclase
MFRHLLHVFLLAGLLGAQPKLPDFDTVEIHTLPVQGNIYMLVGAGGNITLQAGKDGALLVDSMYAPLASKIAAEVKKLTNKPIQYIIDTHVHGDHVGGNAALSALGAPGAAAGFGARATIIAHENVLNRMSMPLEGETAPAPIDWPTDEYDTATKDFSFNGEAVIIFHEPKAHTDGDSIVLFRRSDVISAGDVFTPERYPFIDLARGGSIQGEIAALNHILHLTVPDHLQDGGTRVIPGHGRLCNEADVVEYRDMVTIIRDRVQDMLKRHMTLEQTKAAKPSLDYDTQYGAGDAFVEAVYKSLSAK